MPIRQQQNIPEDEGAGPSGNRAVPDDVEGHGRFTETPDEDVEAHGPFKPQATPDEDVEAHGPFKPQATPDDDVEGHGIGGPGMRFSGPSSRGE